MPVLLVQCCIYVSMYAFILTDPWLFITYDSPGMVFPLPQGMGIVLEGPEVPDPFHHTGTCLVDSCVNSELDLEAHKILPPPTLPFSPGHHMYHSLNSSYLSFSFVYSLVCAQELYPVRIFFLSFTLYSSFSRLASRLTGLSPSSY